MSVFTLALAVLMLAAGAVAGWILNNRLGHNSLEATRQRADELMHGARREGDKLKRAALLESKEQILRDRQKAEHDLRSRKGQLAKQERDLQARSQGLQQQDAQLARREELVEESERELVTRRAELERSAEEAAHLLVEQNAALERVSGMTADEARRQLLTNLRAQTRLEAAQMVREIKEEAQRGAEAEATKIIALAVERAASDFSAERTITHFPLPEGSDLRGRIIGAEGKNIRAFEKATGIQLLLEEQDNRITLSGYHPVKREVARRVLETLVKDGNIHPRRIEELTRRNRRRLDEEMRRAGQDAVKELGLSGVHPEIVKLVGRLKYRSSYGQNVLAHSVEVAWLTGMLAAELRMDQMLARRAGLLHDVGKAIDYEREGTHPEIGAEVARAHGEPEIVINAIASHHEDCEVISPISVLVAAADALSGARPGARRKTVAEYIKRIEKLEELAESFDGVEQCYALQAGREIRVIARSGEVDDARVDLLASDLAARIQAEMDYPGKIKVTVIRELRAVDYANAS
ncbi:MAG TPA: ribonuclease Y [Candidatus Polarisedimenticolaceae bacterium]|nr:ribonuclease Y [Candidatus Polarisedimenticolaceae bacterium]